MTSKVLCGLMLTVAAFAITAPAHANDGWSFSTGADYTTGSYGEDVTTSVLVWSSNPMKSPLSSSAGQNRHSPAESTINESRQDRACPGRRVVPWN